MFKFLINNKKGKFLVIGTLLMILGILLQSYSNIIANIIFYISIFFLGYYATKDAIKSTVEEKKPNVDLLMIIAALGAMIINYNSEAAVLLFIFSSAEILENYVTNKSSNAISELLKFVPEKANLIRENGEIELIDTEELRIKDIVLVNKGDKVPIDGIANSNAYISEAALTGESIPVEKNKGDKIYAGTINEGNSFTMQVTSLKKDTVFSNIIKMVDEAQSMPSKKEKTIDRIERYYVIAVLILVPIFILYLHYINKFSFNDAFYRGMVLLTVSSPCALVASATPATLSAISNCAKNVVLFNKASSIENLKNIEVLLVDKTGTLTTGDFEVEEYECPQDILEKVVYIEKNSNHPIAKSIVKKFSNVDTNNIDRDLEVSEIEGVGMRMGNIIVGKAHKFQKYNDPNLYLEKNSLGKTLSVVIKDDVVVGYFLLSDKIRKGIENVILKFKESLIDIEMLTGDNDQVAKNVSEKLYINKYKSNCSPLDKLNYIKEKKTMHKTVAMIGDGINDAPALALADIGISMGSGTSIAMESSDVIIVNSDLNKVLHSYHISKKLNNIIIFNIVFSISIILLLVFLNALQILDLPSGVVFHEASTILVILNGLRLLKFKKKY